jgi:hypothetical protein
LEVIREVVTQADGLRSVQVSGDVVFAIHPSIQSASTAIVHLRDPSRQDDVVFSPTGVFPNNSAVTIAARRGQPDIDLIPWISDASDPSHPKGTLANVSANQSGSRPRVVFDEWDTFAELRREGSIGGPSITPDLICTTIGNSFAISLYGHVIVIDALPPSLRDVSRPFVPVILAVDEQHLLLMVQHSPQELLSGNSRESQDVYVHELGKGRWKKIRIEGNSSSSRLFGSWLATIVGLWNPDHNPSPGRENERNGEKDGLPDVRGMYTRLKGKWIWSPGTLILQNLDDGRAIRIETRQEDSEVLWVGAGSVIYRINDAIYEGQIVGNQIQNPVILVKDDDVPEIHWIFWSVPK